ncbi:MAG: hypothetical protein C4530_07275 [Desulfobacteraceae bacterium]|nr:MAG: hypothetical protein C4530_07275 [Desulfobacteraceae bacterium]
MFGTLHRWRVILAVSATVLWIGGYPAFGDESTLSTAAENPSGGGTEDRISPGSPGAGKGPESGLRERGRTPERTESGPKAQQAPIGTRRLEDDAPGSGKTAESGIREEGRTPPSAPGDGVQQRTPARDRFLGGAPGTGKQPESGIREESRAPSEAGVKNPRGYYFIPREGSEEPGVKSE